VTGSCSQGNADSLTLGAVGDVMLTAPLTKEAVAFIRSLTGKADVAVANLEMALPRRQAPADKLSTIGSSPELALEVAECGFGAVTLANNHVLDHGPEGLEDTLESVDRAGLFRVGVGRRLSEALDPLLWEEPGRLPLAVVNLACTLPPGAAAGEDRPGVAPLRVTQSFRLEPVLMQEQPGTAPWVETRVETQDARMAEGAISDAVRAVSGRGGRVVVVIHWGVPPYWQAPFQGDLADYQRPLARRLVEAGADAVIGHHPHVLHGVEIVCGRPVIYSLGNFVWPPRDITAPEEVPLEEPTYQSHWRRARAVSAADPRKRESVFADLAWSGHDWRLRLIPVWLDERGEPGPPEPERAEIILTRLSDMSRQLGCLADVSGGEFVIEGRLSH